jgi:nickel superoxide dismutase
VTLTDRALSALQRALPGEPADAHCDVPCGIYDPHAAQVAALTVVRMVQLIEDLAKPDAKAPKEQLDAYLNSMARYVATKEEHATIAKKEVLVIWSDYFLPEHVEKYPDLHDLVWKTMKLASKAKQEINMDASQNLLAGIQRIAEIFWETKGAKTKRQSSLQKSGGELVYPVPAA